MKAFTRVSPERPIRVAARAPRRARLVLPRKRCAGDRGDMTHPGRLRVSALAALVVSAAVHALAAAACIRWAGAPVRAVETVTWEVALVPPPVLAVNRVDPVPEPPPVESRMPEEPVPPICAEAPVPDAAPAPSVTPEDVSPPPLETMSVPDPPLRVAALTEPMMPDLAAPPPADTDGAEQTTTAPVPDPGEALPETFLAEVRARIARRLASILRDRPLFEASSALLDLVLDPDGRLVSVEVIDASGPSLFVRLVREAVYGAAPFPVPTEGRTLPGTLRIRLPLRYEPEW